MTLHIFLYLKAFKYFLQALLPCLKKPHRQSLVTPRLGHTSHAIANQETDHHFCHKAESASITHTQWRQLYLDLVDLNHHQRRNQAEYVSSNHLKRKPNLGPLEIL
jgi:hypothetical protein